MPTLLALLVEPALVVPVTVTALLPGAERSQDVLEYPPRMSTGEAVAPVTKTVDE
jgi:hypothetical protein